MNRRDYRDFQLPEVCDPGTFWVQDGEVLVVFTGPDPDVWADILPSLIPSPRKCPESPHFSIVSNVR